MDSEQYYISSIKFKGFKSFKKAAVQLPRGFVALAGPNGSGKSNVTDAIRFCFGEMGLKSLRAKRVAELINLNSSRGEVTINITGKENFEINRHINEDGKTTYRLNGKKMTRSNVLEALRVYGLEVGNHNIIAQGQVQKIVEMNSRDKRQIIDTVAGIAEFDEKKKEALNELARVDNKISEAKIVIEERNAYLSELEKEKDAAIQYTDAKGQLESARATLIISEYKKLDAQFEESLSKKKEIKGELDQLQSQLHSMDSERQALDKKRKEIADKIGTDDTRTNLLATIQALKVDIAQKSTLIEQKEKELEKIEKQIKDRTRQKEKILQNLEQLKDESAEKKNELDSTNQEIKRLKSSADITDPDKRDSQIDRAQQALSDIKEKKAKLEGTISSKQEYLESEMASLKSIDSELESIGGDEDADEQLSRFSESIDRINEDLDKIFEEEKSINRKIPDIERQLLAAKEKVTVLRSSVSPAAQNPALLAISSLKNDGQRGIFGPVSEMISVDEDYRQAIEASAGNRLNYVITDSSDTANTIIKALKTSRSGRCSFIPLDKIIFGKNNIKVPQGALGRLIDFVDYSGEVDNAMRYLFEDTMLISNYAAAKKIGIGSYRMVTLNGELFERSGVMSGGSNRSSIMARSTLRKAEEEQEALKSQRDSMHEQLYSLRENMQRLRRERSSIELKLRASEAELGSSASRLANRQRLMDQKDQRRQHIDKMGKDISDMQKELEAILEAEAEKIQEIDRIREDSEKRLQEQKEKADSAQSYYEQLMQKLTDLTSIFDSKRSEQKLLNEQISQIDTHVQELEAENKTILKELTETKSQISEKKTSLAKSENELSTISATVKKYADQLKALQDQLDDIGKEQGKLNFQKDSMNRKLNDIEIKIATVQTKLADLQADKEKYKEVKTLDLPKQELESMISLSEQKINQLGAVNLKAPEIYEVKKEELSQMEQKVDTLQTERQAVLTLMEEIETKKRRIFTEAFNVVNDHFKRLIQMSFKGEGSLVLDDPDNPLESGLSMRIRGQHDKKDKYFESMSGGEKSLIGLMFIFALQMHKPSPFYILDEAEAALDKSNASKLADFIKQMSDRAQFIVVTHNDSVLSSADVVLGVSKGKEGSKIVGVQLNSNSPFIKDGKPPSNQ